MWRLWTVKDYLVIKKKVPKNVYLYRGNCIVKVVDSVKRLAGTRELSSYDLPAKSVAIEETIIKTPIHAVYYTDHLVTMNTRSKMIPVVMLAFYAFKLSEEDGAEIIEQYDTLIDFHKACLKTALMKNPESVPKNLQLFLRLM